MIPKYFRHLIDSFTQKQIWDALAVIKQLQLYGITLDEFVKEWENVEKINGEKAAEEMAKQYKHLLAKKKIIDEAIKEAKIVCDKCGSADLVIEAVNISPCTKIGGGWKSSISCNEPDCLHISFSKYGMMDLLVKSKNEQKVK